MAIGFNASGADGKTALVPANGGMSSWLSSTGNVCNDRVDPITVKTLGYSGPGTDYQVRQVTGRRPRMVQWDWRIKAASAAYMNNVENAIQSYLWDGKPYVLTDADGRSTNLAVLVEARILQNRRAVAGGVAIIARWLLSFQVLKAAQGASTL